GGTMFGSISKLEFLRDYWQKRPYLFLGAFANFRSPVSRDELAGLALEDGIASRLVKQTPGQNHYELRHGPFTAADFKKLPKDHWTLLVQDVDKLVAEVHRLLDEFLFLPSWRLDDIMISYAAPSGNVGAHVDSYDVFLLQAYGKRHWLFSDEVIPE